MYSSRIHCIHCIHEGNRCILSHMPVPHSSVYMFLSAFKNIQLLHSIVYNGLAYSLKVASRIQEHSVRVVFTLLLHFIVFGYILAHTVFTQLRYSQYYCIHVHAAICECVCTCMHRTVNTVTVEYCMDARCDECSSKYTLIRLNDECVF